MPPLNSERDQLVVQIAETREKMSGKSKAAGKPGGKKAAKGGGGKGGGKETKAAVKTKRTVAIPYVLCIFLSIWYESEPVTVHGRWQKVENHPLTDELIVIIKGSQRYRQACGFHTDGNVPSGGMTTQDVFEAIACTLCIKRHPELGFTEDDIPKLGKSIKNRVTNGYVVDI